MAGGQITQRGKSLIVNFYYRGERFRVTIPGLRVGVKSHLKTAQGILLQIQADISRDDLNFAKYFPRHPKSPRFLTGSDIKISDRLEQWLDQSRNHCAASTMRDYRSIVRCHLIPVFGEYYLSDLTLGDIREWIYSLDISKKRIRNVIIPLKSIFDEAFEDGIIDHNPFSGGGLLRKMGSSPPDVTPFTVAQRDAILNACEGQIKNIFSFAFWTGLRTSELIALRWDDVCVEKRVAYIWHVRTSAGEKNQTKTSSGKRRIELLPPAIDALLAQQKFTIDGSIFLNPRTQQPWAHDAPLRKTAWIPALRRAGVDYQKPYSTRHTFASLMLSSGKNPMWVASQMGHRDWGMLRRVYGRWIADSESSNHDEISHLWAQDGHKE